MNEIWVQIYYLMSTNIVKLYNELDWGKSRKIKSDWEDIWTKDELKDIAEIESDLNPRSNNENETDELSDDALPF